MPNITIREVDNTSAGNVSVTSNAAYIPGYAITGPINTPVLCNTVAEFVSIFGSTPYVFPTANAWSDSFENSEDLQADAGMFAEAGDYEKSYIYAIELLKLGLPVLYERVFGLTASESTLKDGTGQDAKSITLEDKVEAFTATYSLTVNNITPPSTPSGGAGSGTTPGSGADEPSQASLYSVASLYSSGAGAEGTPATPTITISSRYPGAAGKSISFTITDNEKKIYVDDQGNSTTIKYYTLGVGRDSDAESGLRKVDSVSTSFTFDKRLSEEYTSIKYFKELHNAVDNSGLVVVKFSNCDDTTSLALDDNIKKTPVKLAYPTNSKFNTTSLKEFSADVIYKYLSDSRFDSETCEYTGIYRLTDRGEYAFKFLTSGAYPVFEYDDNTIAYKMLEVAADRGDVVALIDHTPQNNRVLFAKATNSVYNKVCTEFANVPKKNRLGEDNYTYGAMYTPYGIYSCTSVKQEVMLPASFGYLEAFAVSMQSNGIWAATAGATRGRVPNLISLCQHVCPMVADSYQGRDTISINPITRIKPYGYVIWGNRTLKDNSKKGDLTASSLLNVRLLSCDIKRTVYIACRLNTFEQNSNITWLTFQSQITPLLNSMQQGGGIREYSIQRISTTKKATVVARIRIVPIEPVEDWDITLELSDSDVTVVG